MDKTSAAGTDNSPVYILGIDPGSINAGYAVLKTHNKKFSVYDSGTCQIPSKITFLERIPLLYDFFKKLADPLPPFEVSLEALAFVKNPNSFAKLAQARGAILAALGKKPLRLAEYAPNLIKSTVAGYGLASKQSLEKSIGFSIKKMNFTTHDESDAIAVAICHQFYRNSKMPPQTGRGRGRSIQSAVKGKLI